MESLPLVSIVTLNWNTTEITADFLKSINEHCFYPNLEIIIVDNASSVNPTAVFEQIRSDVIVIRNDQNLGFAGGNNIGMAHAKGEFLFIVNNDTEFTPGLIEGLVDIFKKYPDAGVVSPKFHYFFEKGTIEYAGYEPVHKFTGRNGMIGCKEIDQGQYNTITETNYAHGGGMMLPRRVIDQVGGLPEDFIFYYEELDWCEQIKRKGFKIYYQPNSLIYHKESMTTGKGSPFKTYYQTKNRIFFMKRNMPSLNFSIFILYFIFFTLPKNSFTFLLKGQMEHLKAFWKGIFWHFNRKITFN